jgi:osmotically inducible protein OsmC
MTVSRASAVWEGGLKAGTGTFKAASGAFGGAYSFATRFEGAKGTTPEELMAAAHAACFSMALSADLEQAGTPAERVETRAAAVFETVNGKPTISRIELTVRGRVNGLDQAAFARAAEGTKENCPVSRALKGNVAFVVEAKLE